MSLPDPVGWFREPYGVFEQNPLFRASGPETVSWAIACFAEPQMHEYAAAAVAAERERIALLLDAEHEKRKHCDNHAAFYARMVREQT